jgi:hypothetical protein
MMAGREVSSAAVMFQDLQALENSIGEAMRTITSQKIEPMDKKGRAKILRSIIDAIPLRDEGSELSESQ